MSKSNQSKSTEKSRAKSLETMKKVKKVLDQLTVSTPSTSKRANEKRMKEIAEARRRIEQSYNEAQKGFDAGASAADISPGANETEFDNPGIRIDQAAIDYANGVGKRIAEAILKSAAQCGSWPKSMRVTVSFEDAPPLNADVENYDRNVELEELEKLGAGMMDILARLKAGDLEGEELAQVLANMDNQIAAMSGFKAPECACAICQLVKSVDKQQQPVTEDGFAAMRAFNAILANLKRS